MNFADVYLQVLGIVLALLIGLVELLNWLNRKHGGFLRGFAGAIFIGVCGLAAIVFIILRLHR